MNREQHKAWLAALKVGDDVAFDGNPYKVARFTATQIVTTGTYGTRFRRDDGQVIGNRRYGSLAPITDKDRERWEQQELSRWLNNLVYAERTRGVKLPLDVLRAMKAVYDSTMPKDPQ